MKVAVAAVVVLMLAWTVAPQPSVKLKRRPAAESIRTYLSRLEGFGFSGAAVVARDGSVLVESGQGFANREKKIPFRGDTIYDIGSVTKQFTAAAILALESDGKLDVGDPISKYFTDIPEDKLTITVHHLLTHSAGLEMDLGDGDYEKVSRDEIVRRAMQSKLRSTPGERYAYSNAGYSLLAAIVEIVSGKTFETFLRERLFGPAGMNSTGYFFEKTQHHRLAHGYLNGEDWGIGMEKAAATGGDFWNLIGNGGVHSTVLDMTRWMQSLEVGKVLSNEAVKKLFKPQIQITANYRRTNTPLFYGYGWNIWKQPNGKTMIFHLGGNRVFNAAVRYHRDDRTVVIYAANVSEFSDPNYPVPAIEKILAGETLEMPPKVASLSPRQVTDRAGSYREDKGGLLKLDATSGSLEIQGEGQAALSLVSIGKWQNDEKLSALNERTAKIVANSLSRKFESVLAEYSEDSTLNEVTELETLFWKKRHERHGVYKATRVLGTLPSRLRAFTATTLVAIDFERGTTFREYWWTPNGKVGDLGPITAPPIAKYFPTSPKCFTRFDPAEAVVVSTICFEEHGTLDILDSGRRVKLKKL